MKNALLIQQVYPDTPGVSMLELNKERNEKYCQEHGFDYWYEVSNSLKDSDPLKGSWAKVELIRKAISKGYTYIIWLDADTIIANINTDLREACKIDHIGACWHRIPQLHHWNIGALYIGNSENQVVSNFINQWLGSYPGTNDGWLEQGVFNRLAMQSNVVETISDKWNSTIGFTEVPDAVVLGYHGAGDFPIRYELMKAVMTKLQQKADKDSKVE